MNLNHRMVDGDSSYVLATEEVIAVFEKQDPELAVSIRDGMRNVEEERRAGAWISVPKAVWVGRWGGRL